jgi:hypothetical protein
MKNATAKQSARAASITRMVKEVERKAGPYVGDLRTTEQKIATVENTLHILRQNPEEAQKRAPLRGMIKMHEEDLAQLKAEVKQ